MGRHRTAANESVNEQPQMLPDPDVWHEVIGSFRFPPPQQAKIVNLILQGKKDKQIALAMGLKRSTIRTYLARIFARMGVSDRMGLVLCIFANHLQNHRVKGCHLKG